MEDTQVPQDVLPQPWFHGFTSRRDAEMLLKDQPLGSFLLRQSETLSGMVLSYSGSDRCRHFIIERIPDGHYQILGDQRRHSSIPELLDYYKESPMLPFVEYLTTACNKVPDKHYEDIDRIRRQKLNVREVAGGAADALPPDRMEDRPGLPSLPPTPTSDPVPTQAAHPGAAEGGVRVTRDDATYQEVPDKHYEDIDRIRRRKLNVRELAGGAADALSPDRMEDRLGSPSLSPTPTSDPLPTQAACPGAVEGGVRVTWGDATFQEVPDKHYEDIDRIRRRKLNVREVAGGAADALPPDRMEDRLGSPSLPPTPTSDPVPTQAARPGAMEEDVRVTRGDSPYQEVPDKHYEDIDRIRRRKLNVREVAGGAADALPPDRMADRPGSASLPPTPTSDPMPTQAARPGAVEGGVRVTQGDATYQEVPDKHYEDIDRIRRRKRNVREVAGGAADALPSDRMEDQPGSASLPPTPTSDPMPTQAACPGAMEGGVRVTQGDAPYQEVPDKHYEHIDRIRRRKLNVREVAGGAADALPPDRMEDRPGSASLPPTPTSDPVPTQAARPGAMEGGVRVTRADATYQEVPDKHYEDIDRIRRRKLNVREVAGGAADALPPDRMEDRLGSPSLPPTPTSDPVPTQAARPGAMEGGVRVTRGIATYQEVPDKHYEDIDRIRRRKLNVREVAGGAADALPPDRMEDRPGSASLPPTPTSDPVPTQAARPGAMAGGVRVTQDDATYQEVPDKHYEDIDRIRRRKLNVREVAGGAADALPLDRMEDRPGSASLPPTPTSDPVPTQAARPGAVEVGVRVTRGIATYQEVPDKHYEDIDRIRRRKLNVREVAGGAADALPPDRMEDRPGSASLPPTPTSDPVPTQAARPGAMAGGVRVTQDDATYQEVPDKHYEDIDRIRRRKLNVREVAGGAADALPPDRMEDRPGLASLPPTPTSDPVPTQAARPGAVEVGVRVTRDNAPYQEVPDKHYEDIDRIRRRKLNVREVAGGAADALPPDRMEDRPGSASLPPTPTSDPVPTQAARPGAMEGGVRVTQGDATYQDVPDKHYEDIDRIQRRKLNVREVAGGAADALPPDRMDDRPGSPSLPPTPTSDPVPTQPARPGAVEVGVRVTRDDAPYQEVPDKHYEDIDRIRRWKLNVREVAGGAADALPPDRMEDRPGSPSLPPTPTSDPVPTQAARPGAMQGGVRVTQGDATYQELPEGHGLGRKTSTKSRTPTETEASPTLSQATAAYAKVNKARSHVYTEPADRPGVSMEITHTYSDAHLYAEPSNGIICYALPKDRQLRATGRELHHVYSELDSKQTRPGNLYCPTPTKGSTMAPDLSRRQPAEAPRSGMVPTTPPRWLPRPPLTPGAEAAYTQPVRHSLGLPTDPDRWGLARDKLELDDDTYGVLARLGPSRPEPDSRPVPDPRPVLSRPEPDPRPVPDPRPIPNRPEPEPRPVLNRPERDPRPMLCRTEQDLRPLPSWPEADLKPTLNRPERDPRPVPNRPDRSLKPALTMSELDLGTVQNRLEPELKPMPSMPAPPPRPIPSKLELTPRPDPSRPQPIPRPLPNKSEPGPKPLLSRPEPGPKPLPTRPEPGPKPLLSRPEPGPKPLLSRPELDPWPLPCRAELDPRPLPSRPKPDPRLLPSRPELDPRPLPSRAELDPRSLPSRPEPDLRPLPSRPEPDLRPLPCRPKPDLRPFPGRPELDPRPFPWRLEPDPRPLPSRPEPDPRPLPSRPEPDLRPLLSRPEPDPRPLPSRPEPDPRPLPSRPEPDLRPLPSRPEPDPRPLPSRPEPDPRPLPSRPELDPRPLPDKPEPGLNSVPGRPEPASQSVHIAPAAAFRQVDSIYEQLPEEFLRPPPYVPNRSGYRRGLRTNALHCVALESKQRRFLVGQELQNL
ncbi:uncharacterized protein LOC132207453 [Stegostoma tigrinum]|uniref:uncharacterized protein LOC132207453 n=1 Tax=Stegostoma tigrinum TaxID=3053191 RepID=UPI002870224A|nr:uncharacterized protein LOC132207453 [Stegostoma tigrinum]